MHMETIELELALCFCREILKMRFIVASASGCIRTPYGVIRAVGVPELLAWRGAL